MKDAIIGKKEEVQTKYEPVYRLKQEKGPENKKILKRLLEDGFDFIYSRAGDDRVIRVKPDNIQKALSIINEVKGTPTLF